MNGDGSGGIHVLVRGEWFVRGEGGEVIWVNTQGMVMDKENNAIRRD
jgi:hypothetical protein